MINARPQATGRGAAAGWPGPAPATVMAAAGAALTRIGVVAATAVASDAVRKVRRVVARGTCDPLLSISSILIPPVPTVHSNRSLDGFQD